MSEEGHVFLGREILREERIIPGIVESNTRKGDNIGQGIINGRG